MPWAWVKIELPDALPEHLETYLRELYNSRRRIRVIAHPDTHGAVQAMRSMKAMGTIKAETAMKTMKAKKQAAAVDVVLVVARCRC